MKLSYRKFAAIVTALCGVWLAACSTSPALTSIAAPTSTLLASVPTALPLSLLTPVVTATFTTPSVPIRLENTRLSMVASVDTADGALDQLGLPTIQAGYWPQSAPLGTGGNTVIIGFAVAGVFDLLPKLVTGDILLVTDQHSLTRAYRVATAGTAQDLASAASAPGDLTLISLTMSTPLAYFEVHAVIVP